MTALVEVLLKGLGVAVEPGSLREERGDLDLTLTVELGPGDLERLDGREHRTAKAVRQVLSASAGAGPGQPRLHLVVRARA